MSTKLVFTNWWTGFLIVILYSLALLTPFILYKRTMGKNMICFTTVRGLSMIGEAQKLVVYCLLTILFPSFWFIALVWFATMYSNHIYTEVPQWTGQDLTLSKRIIFQLWGSSLLNIPNNNGFDGQNQQVSLLLESLWSLFIH